MTHVAVVSTVLETHAGTTRIPCATFAAPTKEEVKSLAEEHAKELSAQISAILGGGIVAENAMGKIQPMGPVLQFLKILGIGDVNFAVSIKEAKTSHLEMPQKPGILLV